MVVAVVIPTGVFIRLLLRFHPRVQQDPLDTTSSMLRTGSSTDSSTSATRIIVKYDEIDGGRSDAVGKSVKKSSKSRKIVKKSKKSQRSKQFAKAIGSEEHLAKYRSSVKELELPIEL